MTKSPFDDGEYQAWADDMREKLIPKMRGSEHVMIMAPSKSAKFDITFAVQIGAAILLEKPLIVLVDRRSVLAPKLRAIADRIIEIDFKATDQADVQEQIRQAMTELGKQ